MKFEVVEWDAIPVAPRMHASKYHEIYFMLETLSPGQAQAIKVQVSGPRELRAIRKGAKQSFKLRGKRVLSSRNADSTVLYLWVHDEAQS